MPQYLGGDYTLAQAVHMTRENAPSRFENMERDVIKRIEIQQVRSYDPDQVVSSGELSTPLVKYVVRTRSYPQYREYLSKTGKNKKQREQRSKQRTVHHDYETIIEFGDDGITMNTTKWKMRVGSGRKWKGRKPPQNQIHQIYNETVEHWRKLLPNEEAVRERKRKHRRKKYKYLSVGDFLAKKYGIMMDFSTRLAFVYLKHGHLYGYCYGSTTPPREVNPQQLFFLTKHTLRILDALGRKGVLKR